MPDIIIIVDCNVNVKFLLISPDIKYNVVKYIDSFNKKVQPLLVAFKPEIRDEILVDDPQKRGYFTKQQCELDNGHPLKESGQDDINDVLTLSESEVIFWNRVNRDPYFMYFDDSINHIDEYWVKHNREVLTYKIDGSKDLDEDDIIETNGNDYANHVLPDLD